MIFGKLKKVKALPPEKIPDANLPQIDSLIRIALKEKTGVDQLKELMRMKYEYEEREATKMFHKKFCEMQSEFPTITKSKSVKNYNGEEIYRYAPLENIIKEIGNLLKEYGFSYHWDESFERDGYKRIYCHIIGHGHKESAYTDVPIMDANKMTNSAQQAGSSSTYGKRYSLCGLLGIMCDEDDDGRGASDKKQTPAPKQTNNAVPKQPTKPAPQSKPKTNGYSNDLDGDFKIQYSTNNKEFIGKKIGDLSESQCHEFFDGVSEGSFKDKVRRYIEKRFNVGDQIK